MLFFKLGGCWVKLGQALALRYDLLPREYCEALFTLLDSNRETSFSKIERSLPRVVRESLTALDPRPIASGSIAQIHRARLTDGTDVVIKVRHPGALRRFEADISIIGGLLQIATLLRFQRATNFDLFFGEFQAWTLRELDLSNEVANWFCLRQNVAGSHGESYPVIYPELSSSSVIVMTFVPGRTLAQIMADKNNPLGSRKRFTLARRLLFNTLNQIYVFGVFHADLHPANIVPSAADRATYLDFGIVGYITDGVRKDLILYAASLFLGDASRATSQFLSWIDPGSEGEPSDAENDALMLHTRYIAWLQDVERPTEGAQFDIELMQILQKYTLMLRSDFFLYIKAVTTLDSVLYEISPRFPLQREASAFFEQLLLPDVPKAVADPMWALALLRTERRVDNVGVLIDSLTVVGEDFGQQLRDLRRGMLPRLLFPAVISIGILLAVLFGGGPLPSSGVTIAGYFVSYNRLLVAALALSAIFLVSSLRRLNRISDLERRSSASKARASLTSRHAHR